MNLSSAVRTAKSVITANSPVLLVGTAITGVISTGILAARGGYKARGIIDEERGRRVLDATDKEFDTELDRREAIAQIPEITVKEHVKLTWLCYAVPGVTAASTIASVVGVHTIHTKRHAALAGLYAVTSGKLDDYREQAEELLGTKKTQALNDAVGQKAVEATPFDSNQVVITPDGSELMLDQTSGRYFTSSVTAVERAFAQLNMQLVEDGDATLNDFYDRLGLAKIPIGDRLGWSGTKVEPRFGGVTVQDGDQVRSAVSFCFHKEPKDILGTV